MAKTKPKKPQALEIPSDDCEVEVDGEKFYPHVGEWIKAIPGMTVGNIGMSHRLNSLQTEMAAVEDDHAEDDKSAEAEAGRKKAGEEQIAIMAGAFDEGLAILQGRIFEWNWTDDNDDRYEQPRRDPEVFRKLRTEEFYYLIGAVQNGGADQSKNASRPSQTSSSASRRRRGQG